MLLLTERQIDRLILHGRAFLFVGLALMALPFVLPRGWGTRFFTGFMLASLGVYGFTFRKWRTEPGLWMLAVFLTVTLGPCWALFEYSYWRANSAVPAMKQAAPAFTWNQLRVSVDAIIALMLFAVIVKLAATVAIENWKRTRIVKPKLDPQPADRG